ncbi:MAG: FHA domain-containing protein [Schlesneria sp.]
MSLIIECLKYLTSGQKRNTLQDQRAQEQEERDQQARDQIQYNRLREEKILSLSQVTQFRGLVLELISTSRPSPQIGQLFQLHGGRMVIGRSLNCEVWIDSLMVNRQHAAITEHQGQCQIIDLKSASGTYVNGVPVTGSVEINDGDVIRVSCVAMRFHASYAPKNRL